MTDDIRWKTFVASHCSFNYPLSEKEREVFEYCHGKQALQFCDIVSEALKNVHEKSGSEET